MPVHPIASDGFGMAAQRELKVFSGTANPRLAKRICDHLAIPLGRIQIDRFPDGEIALKVEEDVRGRDVFVVQPTCPPVDEHLMELLVTIDCLRRASADQITAVIPYFGYARQDRKDEGRVPITAKLVANLITEAGCHRVLCMDLHAAQIQGFFDVPVDHLYAVPRFHQFLAAQRHDPDTLAMVSPDVGGSKLTQKFQRRLGGTLAIIDKQRISATQTRQGEIIGGPVRGRVCYLFDDMISTGSSIAGAARMLKERGAAEIHVCATHGLFCGDALETLSAAPIDRILCTDTVPPPPVVAERLPLEILTVASIFGEAIRRIHNNESVSYLFQGELGAV